MSLVEHACAFDGRTLRCTTCGAHALDVIKRLYYEARAETDQVRRERDSLRKTLKRIVETPAEVEMRGDCAYCQSKTLAREALEETHGRS